MADRLLSALEHQTVRLAGRRRAEAILPARWIYMNDMCACTASYFCVLDNVYRDIAGIGENSIVCTSLFAKPIRSIPYLSGNI